MRHNTHPQSTHSPIKHTHTHTCRVLRITCVYKFCQCQVGRKSICSIFLSIHLRRTYNTHTHTNTENEKDTYHCGCGGAWAPHVRWANRVKDDGRCIESFDGWEFVFIMYKSRVIRCLNVITPTQMHLYIYLEQIQYSILPLTHQTDTCVHPLAHRSRSENINANSRIRRRCVAPHWMVGFQTVKWARLSFRTTQNRLH